ncbi:MAG: hypothetical protein FWH21_01615 [Kiritimatiellaeota bacterium]|nr:hypothetical protein [Kiritimatiellota bacterium]
MMKKVVLPMVVMTALCAHSATLEEARRKVRDSLEGLGEYHSVISYERWAKMKKDLDSLDQDVKMSVYLEIMKEKFGGPDTDTVNRVMGRFRGLDGLDAASYGNQDALDWARKMVRSGEQRFTLEVANAYLLLKGDARDLAIISPDLRDHLAKRVAGTNVIDYYPDPFEVNEESGWFDPVPSVTNTGPQGLYVYKILRQCWDNLEVETRMINGYPRPFQDRSKIPAELLTMVVSFDAGGNPVCNVDLAKYGLTMPALDVPVKPQAEGGTPEGGLQHSVPPRDPGSRLWIPAALAALTLLIGVLYARRNKLK